MLFSDKAPDKMFYAGFILILTTSPPSSGCCYSIFSFLPYFEKTRKVMIFFFLKIKAHFCVMLKDWQMILCGK